MKKLTLLTLLFALLAASLAGCAGGRLTRKQKKALAEPVGPIVLATLSRQDAARGILSALRGDDNTFILRSKDSFVFIWQSVEGQAFTIFNRTGKPAADLLDELLNSNSYDYDTMNDLFELLKANGWKVIKPEHVPAALAAAIKGLAGNILQTGTTTLPTILIFPVMKDDPIWKLLVPPQTLVPTLIRNFA